VSQPTSDVKAGATSQPSRLDLIAQGQYFEPVIHNAVRREEHVLEIKNFNLWYGEKQALFDINMPIPKGQVTALVGPSGCGKSTLLRIVAGLDTPSTGRVLLDGQPVERPGPDRGMVFQSYTLFPWLTVRENVLFGRRAKPDVADRLIAQVGLRGFEYHYPKTLSGGMQQRVGLARALVVEPQILLLDEPFGALDAQTKRLLQDDLGKTLSEEGSTAVFITHDMAEAVYLCDRIIVLTSRPGRVAAEFEVALERPRDESMRKQPYFAELVDAIWRELKSMVHL
jgi:NitT/TauT family transport system ATP-binding protein